MTDEVCVRTYWTRIQAETAASMLEAAGIPVVVQTDDYGSWLPVELGKSAVRVLVSSDDAPRAREILEDAPEDMEDLGTGTRPWVKTVITILVVLELVLIMAIVLALIIP